MSVNIITEIQARGFCLEAQGAGFPSSSILLSDLCPSERDLGKPN